MLTSTPPPVRAAARAAAWSTQRALAVAPRSSSTPGGTRSRDPARSTPIVRQPATGPTVTVMAGPSGVDGGEIAVIAENPEGRSDRRVDQACGEASRPEGGVDGDQQLRRHGDPLAGGGVDAGEVRVGPEPAAGQVDPSHLVLQHGARRIPGRRVGHQQDGRRSERVEAHRVDHGAHVAPEVT